MLKVFFAIVLLAGSFSFGHELSAQRPADQSWVISKKNFKLQDALKIKFDRSSDSAMDSAVVYDQVDVNQIPEFSRSADEIQKMFEDIRNVRFLEDPLEQNFSRRITWLYPMDGCFARAEWVAHLLKKKDPTLQFGRVFIFGNLKVKTKNSSSGSVTWWYHVAVVVRHQDKAFVFDPSLDVSRPLELADWVKLQVPNPSKDATLSVCSSTSYSPASDCASPDEDLLSDNEASEEIADYLTLERKNLKKLGRDPQVELGENPPW